MIRGQWKCCHSRKWNSGTSLLSFTTGKWNLRQRIQCFTWITACKEKTVCDCHADAENRKTNLDIFQIIQKAYLFWEMRRKMSTMFKANKLCSVQLVQIWPYFTRQSIFNERKESFRFLSIIIRIWTYKTTSEISFHTINQFIQLRWRQLFWCVAERNLHFASRRTKFTSCYSLQAWKETKKHVLKTRKYMLVKIKLSKLLLL